MSGLEHALAGARHEPARPAAGRSAFVIGNTGKLGEELLNVLLEDASYGEVHVAVRKPMRSHVPRLHPHVVQGALTQWNPFPGPGQAPQDLYLCIEPPARSFWKIPKPYVGITGAEAAALARRLRASGARRVAIITPLEALLQLGMAPAIADGDEMSILEAGFERVLVLRPSQEGGRVAAQGIFGRLARGVTGALAGVMTPRELQPVRVRRAAQEAVRALAAMEDGVQVIGAARLRELVGDPLESAGGRGRVGL